MCVFVWQWVCMNFPKRPPPPPLYSAWKAFQELPLLVTGLVQIKAMPPRQAFPQHFESRSTDKELFDFLSRWATVRACLGCIPSGWSFFKSDSWGMNGESCCWTDGRMACTNCKLLPLFGCSSALKAAKAFSDAWCAPNVSVSVLHLGFSSLYPQPTSLFIVPSVFLTVNALDVLMLFTLKWQSILHFFFFFFINIHTGKRYFFCLCCYICLLLLFLWIFLLISNIIISSWFLAAI